MSVFKRRKYGLKVVYSSGKVDTFWYGMDRDKRDRKHNDYVRRPDVKVVINI